MLDHVRFVTAPDCPAPGKVLNGDFEGTGGWTANGAGAEVAVGVGTGGGRGGRLSSAPGARCALATLSGSISVPSSMTRPALVFKNKGTMNHEMRVSVGDAQAVVVGTGTFQQASVCLRRATQGFVVPLVFSTVPTDACAGAAPTEFAFDDLVVQSDPSCPDPG